MHRILNPRLDTLEFCGFVDTPENADLPGFRIQPDSLVFVSCNGVEFFVKTADLDAPQDTYVGEITGLDPCCSLPEGLHPGDWIRFRKENVSLVINGREQIRH